MSDYFLCNASDIPNYQALEFEVETTTGKLGLLVLRLDKDVHAYTNNCPHLNIPLNWQPNQFMSLEGTHIQCSTHGALFTLEEGNCIAGPCRGQNLEQLNVELRNKNEVWLTL